MERYNNNKIIAKSEVNGNTVLLTQDEETKKYISYWGPSESKNEVEFTGPIGKKLKKSSAIKKFLEMVEASKYLTFSKL